MGRVVVFKQESFPKSVPGVVLEPPLYFLSLYSSNAVLSNSSTCLSCSSNSYSLLAFSSSFYLSSSSFLFTSSSFFRMCSKFFLNAFSLSLILTWCKFRRSSTLGLSFGSIFSIHRTVLINSSE